MVRRFVLTGTPGSGKTSILHSLASRGFATIAEAATDVIAGEHAAGNADPWLLPKFIEQVASLQIERIRQSHATDRESHARSPICTLALARGGSRPVPPILEAELERLQKECVFERRVFFVQNIGFVQPTAARRIGFEESLAFERL